MKIQNQVTTMQVVSISYLEYLEYLRNKFDIVQAVDGVDEINAISEAVAMISHQCVYDRNVADLKIRKEITQHLFKLYRDAANYVELLQAHLEFEETERKAQEELTK